MTPSPTLLAIVLIENFIGSHLDNSHPTCSTCHCPSHLGPPTMLQIISFEKTKTDVKTCLNKKPEDRFFFKGKCQHLYHGIQGPPKPCSLSRFISSQVTCIPVTPEGHTVFKHSQQWIIVCFCQSLCLECPSSARPKFLAIIIKYHCPFRIQQSLFCVPRVLCSSRYSSADLI